MNSNQSFRQEIFQAKNKMKTLGKVYLKKAPSVKITPRKDSIAKSKQVTLADIIKSQMHKDSIASEERFRSTLNQQQQRDSLDYSHLDGNWNALMKKTYVDSSNSTNVPVNITKQSFNMLSDPSSSLPERSSKMIPLKNMTVHRKRIRPVIESPLFAAMQKDSYQTLVTSPTNNSPMSVARQFQRKKNIVKKFTDKRGKMMLSDLIQLKEAPTVRHQTINQESNIKVSTTKDEPLFTYTTPRLEKER